MLAVQVTIEDHPHMAGKHASVHPCRHGAVMKKIIDVLMSRGVEPEVDKYGFFPFCAVVVIANCFEGIFHTIAIRLARPLFAPGSIVCYYESIRTGRVECCC